MRVLVVEPAGLLWGSERALLDLLSHIDNSRYVVTVVCPQNSPFLKRVRELKIRAIEAPLQLLHKRGRLARLSALVSLSVIMLRVRPDVVHVNQAGVLRLVSLAARIVGCPVLCHVRLFEDARRIRENNGEWIRSHRFIAISHAISLALGFGEPTNRLSVDCVYDPLDGEEFRRGVNQASISSMRAELGIPERAIVVSVVGRVCQEKRQELLIEAAMLLQNENIFVLIVGGSPSLRADQQPYRDYLIDRVRNSSLARKVVFTGMRDDVASLMVASNIIVLTSDEEPLGRVLLEALSLRRHIIAPATGGAKEIVGENERGLSFQSGNAAALSKCIGAIISDQSAADVRTALGAEWVETVCSPARHAREIQRIYDQLGTTVSD